MGNLQLSGLFRADADAASGQVDGGRFMQRRIRNDITYYYTPLPEALCPARDSESSPGLCPLSDPPSADPSSSPLLPDSPSHADASPHQRPDSTASTSRPLLLFFPWLGAKPVGVAKYRDLYLERGLDVLVVRSGLMHFLWPRWGLDYGREVLKILEEPQFSGRPVLVHASSIGGYTFTQILTLMAQGQSSSAGLAHRVVGQIFDSLVLGTLEHMAIGLGKTLLPRLEGLVKNTALFYFWLFKTHTADFYNNSIRVFQDSPVTAPALFYFSEDDALCDPVAMEKCIGHWRARGVAVESRKWRESTHAAHMRRHPDDYLSSLEKFLKPLAISPLEVKG